MGLVLALLSTMALAQAHRCTVNGRTVVSDRPCAAPARLVAYGPAPARVSTAPLPPSMPRAQDHLRYLGPACASISEAIRTGPARGVRADVLLGLREEYQQKCAVDDHEARQQVHQDQRQAHAALLAERDRRDAAAQDAKALATRCNGMRDVIAVRRQREAALNPKEVEALRQLEQTFNAVCLPR